MFGVVLTCAETRTRDAVLTQVMANKFMHFDTLPKHGPTNSEEYGAVLPVFIKDFENRCQDCWKKSIFSILAILFSVDMNYQILKWNIWSCNWTKKSKIDHPQQRFAEKDMIELYPLQLQPGDKAENWIFYTNALRHIPIQYNQSLILPLPLHLAECLEEYLFDA